MPIKIQTIFSVLLLVSAAYTFQSHILRDHSNSMKADDCQFPRIQEFITNYVLPANDLSYFINNNMSQFQIANMGKNLGTQFKNITASMIYAGQNKEIIDLGDFRFNIVNDGFNLKVIFNASVFNLGVTHHYVVVASAKIPLNYTKSYDESTQSFAVSGTKLTIDSNILKITSMTPENQKDKVKITKLFEQEMIPQIVKNFVDINNQLNSNVKRQHLGEIYPNTTYTYNFQTESIQIDMRTKAVGIYNQTVSNGLQGALLSTSNPYCPIYLQLPKQGYSEFFSIQFIRNLADYLALNYEKWQNMILNKSNMRTTLFQFKLVDMEFLFDDQVFQSYSRYYLSNLYFSCSLGSIKSLYIGTKEEIIHGIVDWQCKGYIDILNNQTSDDTDILIADFIVHLDHQVQLDIRDGQIQALVDGLNVVDVDFNDVGDFKVINIDLAKNYLGEMLFEFRRYIIGNNFKVKKDSSKLLFQVDQKVGDGIWIG